MRGFNFSERFSPAGGWRSLIVGGEEPSLRAKGSPGRRSQPDWIDELDDHRDPEAANLAFEGELSDVIAARTGRAGQPVPAGCRGERQPGRRRKATARRGK